MKKITKIIECQNQDAFQFIGYNLIEGIEPTVVSENGCHPEYKNWKKMWDPTAYKLITAPYTGDCHIDIFSEDFSMTYDLGEEFEINGIFTSGFWQNDTSGVYMLGQYELYIAEKEDELYTEKSLIVNVDNTDISLPKTPRQSEAFFQCEGVRGRYFGFKVNKACVADNITRLGHIGVYCDRVTEQRTFLDKIIQNNYLQEQDIELSKGFIGCICSLTDGNVFDVEDAVVLNKGKVILTSSLPAEYLTVTGMIEGITVYTADSKDALWQSPAVGELTVCDTHANPESCYFYKFDTSYKYIGIKMNDGAVLEQLGLYTYNRVADVELDNIRTQDFIGIGANDIPTAWMSESRRNGFKNVYWPVYCYRMDKSKPSTIRVWFQVDWVVTNEEDYKQGKCNFQGDKMRAFLKYMDAYEKAGIDIELNFGWKHSTEIQEWFSISSTGTLKSRGAGRAASVPKDFDGFAKCCATTVKFLCEERGYTCLKHLTFYNEPNYGDDSPTVGDFVGYYGKSKEMWEVMLRAVARELKAIGADKYIDYWLAEQSGNDKTELQWIDYMMSHCREFNALNAFHRYHMRYDSRLEYFNKVVEHAGDVGAAATEFAIYTTPQWDQSNIEYVMSMLHSGIRGGLYWLLQGVHLTDPLWIYLGAGTGTRDTWFKAPFDKETIRTESYPCHEFSLFTHYLPRHSKVLETKVYDDDTRVEVIETPDGNYTVFVESKASQYDKSVCVNFSKTIGKTFTKHVYKESEVKLDGNLYVPRVCGEIEVEDALKDNIGTDYQLICYTTLPVFKQISLNNTFVNLPLGESFKFEAELIDCEGDVEWEIVSSEGVPCSIDNNGMFTLLDTETTRIGDLHCVKATLKNDPSVYAIALVEIV